MSVLRPIILLLCLWPAYAAYSQSGGLVPSDAPAPAPNEQQEVKYTLLKPDDKTSENVSPEERNPYATGNKTNITVKAEGEETEIRKRLESLRVVGSVRGKNGELNIMLGDIVLEVGRMMPRLLPEQTLDLQVKSIKEDAIELLWVEKKATGLPARVLTLPMDLRANVKYVMQGQVSTKKEKKGKANAEDEGEKMGIIVHEDEGRGLQNERAIGTTSPPAPANSKSADPRIWNQAMNRENAPPTTEPEESQP